MAQVKKCDNCGSENPLDNLFCQSCDAALNEKMTQDLTETDRQTDFETGRQLVEKGQLIEAKKLYQKYSDEEEAQEELRKIDDAREAAQISLLEANYERAIVLMRYEQFAEAEMLLSQLKDFEDAPEKLAQVQELMANQGVKDSIVRQEKIYHAAIENMSDGKLSLAQHQFKALGDYADATEKLTMVTNFIAQNQGRDQESLYQEGLEAFSSGDFGAAITLLSKIPYYLDVPEKLDQIKQAEICYAKVKKENERQNAWFHANRARTQIEFDVAVDRLRQINYPEEEIATLEAQFVPVEIGEEQIELQRKSPLKVVVIVILTLCLVGGFAYYKLR